MNVWQCESCGQRVELNNGKPKRSQTHYENCLLKDHFVGDECVAFRDPKRAMQLLPAEPYKNGKLIDPLPNERPYTLRTLVKYITDKHLPDQQAYTIMVGERIYRFDKIQKLRALLGS